MLPLRPDELEAAARERLSPVAYAFYASGAGDEVSVVENVVAWRRWLLRPRVGVDVSKVSTATEVLGSPVALPVLLAPCGFNALAHPDGELAVARAAAAAGTVQIVAMSSSFPPEDIAVASEARQWFQLYAYRDRARNDDLVDLVEDAGFAALVVTVDSPVLGIRRVGFADIDAFLREVSAVGRPPVLTDFNSGLDWREIERIGGRTRLPMVLKGVLHSEDARIAAELGVRALVVSNHGGRQLDGTIPPALALPDVVEAAGEDVEVYVDGGVRSGVDVLRALALGARAVLIGRPYLWALAIAGQDGVRELLDRIRRELNNAMALAGQTDASRVEGSIVVGDRGAR